MSSDYKAITWNANKKRYDLVLWAGILLYAIFYVVVQNNHDTQITAETLLIRLTATLSFGLLTLVLSIGPLCRISPRFLPLLYNRRHFGVSLFIVAATHGLLALLQYHGGGEVNPLVSLFAANPNYGSLAQFPYMTLGFFALVILFLMAATSHDFWLKHLSPRYWKTLHILVYLAYGLVLLHVLTGYLQTAVNATNVALFGTSFGLVLILHLWAGVKSIRPVMESPPEGYIALFEAEKIEDKRAKIARVNGREIAVFRNGDQFSAVHNRCRHQMGPLGEGRIVDGCITCPWHGYQYLPHNGQSPPPFEEKISTFKIKIHEGMVYVDPNPLPPGTETKPAKL